MRNSLFRGKRMFTNGKGWWNFGRFAFVSPPYNYLTKNRERPQNLWAQVRGFWPLKGKEAQRNLLNVVNEGLFWKGSILLVNISKEHFQCHWFTSNLRNHFCHHRYYLVRKTFYLQFTVSSICDWCYKIPFF